MGIRVLQARLAALRSGSGALPHLWHRWSEWRSASPSPAARRIAAAEFELRECSCGAVQARPTRRLLEELQLDSPHELDALQQQLQESAAQDAGLRAVA